MFISLNFQHEKCLNLSSNGAFDMQALTSHRWAIYRNPSGNRPDTVQNDNSGSQYNLNYDHIKENCNGNLNYDLKLTLPSC